MLSSKVFLEGPENYYRLYFPNLARIASALTDMLRKEVNCERNQAHQETFSDVEASIGICIILYYYDHNTEKIASEMPIPHSLDK